MLITNKLLDGLKATVQGQIGATWKILAQQSVGVFV